jgi:Rieske Fe-S protein
MKFFRRPSTEPLWKEEFSVHSIEERYVSRRQFSKFLVLTSLGMFIGNLWIVVKSWFDRPAVFPQQRVAALEEIAVGDVKLFTYPTPADHCILVRTAADHYAAFSQKCTHLSCAVYYARKENRLVCPCHKGYFSARDGSVLAGPPPRRLPQIVLQNHGGELIAVGMRTNEDSGA